jgi:hypothetical protein
MLQATSPLPRPGDARASPGWRSPQVAGRLDEGAGCTPSPEKATEWLRRAAAKARRPIPPARARSSEGGGGRSRGRAAGRAGAVSPAPPKDHVGDHVAGHVGDHVAGRVGNHVA